MQVLDYPIRVAVIVLLDSKVRVPYIFAFLHLVQASLYLM